MTTRILVFTLLMTVAMAGTLYSAGEDCLQLIPIQEDSPKGTNMVSMPVYGYSAITNDESKMVKRLAGSGAVCREFGHVWEDGRTGETNGLVFADYHLNTSFRHCRLCGKTQTLTLEWK